MTDVDQYETDRFVIETGSGTVAHIIDVDPDQAETDSRSSFGLSAPGEKMCSRGYRDYRSQQVPFSAFVKRPEKRLRATL